MWKYLYYLEKFIHLVVIIPCEMFESNSLIVFYKNIIQNFQEKNLQVVPQLAAHIFSS